MRKTILYFLTLSAIILTYSCDNDEEAQPELQIEYSITDASTHNGSDGSIDVAITGGSKPYTISWSNGSSDEDLTNLSAGLYTITVTDSKSTELTENIVVSHPFEEGTVSDYEGNIYKTVKIGDQWWMAENLKSTKDKNGNSINSLVYGDEEIYGRLYNWSEAMKAAPDGWHIPTFEEWIVLIQYLGGTNLAGGKMKQVGTEYWNEPNTGACNSSGFTALPAGESDGHFQFLGEYAIFWSSSEVAVNSYAKYFYLNNEEVKITAYTYVKSFAYSIRCIKD